MKVSYCIGLLLFINTPLCYSQLSTIDKKYTGASFVKEVNVDELINKCYSHEDFWEKLSNQQREIDRNRCPLNTTEFDFNRLYDLIDKRTVIYRDGDLELVMDRKKSKIPSNKPNYSLEDIVYEVNLSLVYKQQIRDTITLASYAYNSHQAFYLHSKYYYIDSNNSDVYTLSLNEYSRHIESVKYKYYQIDKENLQFKLKEFLFDDGYKYRIIYPDQFEVLDKSGPSNFETDKLRTCYQDEYNTTCNIESYNYYHDLLVKKLALLQAK
ncbi:MULTISPECIES: hypothetical protein, partial [unclassified Gilliamella]|uniref:hypothetical protein n=1 Tax=unclassified Gilliamella TaxID=2685620 RepID=UPI001146EC5C